ncbi:hypothetical protein BGZ68_003070 [Mortierella alpina]|nr:hypothetical protein BGZ68_003070 [Mortierella alpina]
MPFPADKKDPKQANGHIADAVTPEQEREMFGQQSPYATGNELPTAGAPSATASAYAGPPSVYAAPPSVHGAPSSVYAAPPSARPSSAAPATSSPIPAANPQTQDRESSVQNRGPQGHTLRDVNADMNPCPTAASASDPDRARRFSKFWLLFFVVIVILLLMDDGDTSGGEDECNGRPRYTKTLSELSLSPTLDDFTVSISNMVGLVTMEQAPQDDPTPFTRLLIEGSALDREDVGVIQLNVRDIATASVVSISNSESSTVECLRATVKIVVPANARRLKRMKMSISEGNLTINLLDSLHSQRIQVQDLDARVITGHLNVRANVLSWARLGGSVGTIGGKILIGKDLQVAMVDGNVELAIAQSQETDTMDAKVEVMNGSVKVDMVTPYQGTFKVETNNGLAKVDPDPARTHFTSLSNKSIKGWNSIKGKEPGYSASNLRLLARNGDVELSMARLELLRGMLPFKYMY